MAFSLTWNSSGYDFTDEVIDIPDLNDNTEIATEKVPRRHGLYVSEEPTRSARTIKLEGTFAYTTAAAARARLDTLLYQLNLGLKQLRFNSSRYIMCYKKSFTYKFMPGSVMTSVLYSVEFFAPDPFWYAVSPTSVTTNATSSPKSWTHANSGDELVFPVFTIKAVGGPINGMSLTNNTISKDFTYGQITGTIATGKSLVVDTGNFTVMNDGTSDLANFGDTFFWLPAGNSSLTLVYTGTDCDVTIAYNNRFNAPAWD